MNSMPSDAVTKLFDRRMRAALRESVRSERPSPHVRETVLLSVYARIFPQTESAQVLPDVAATSNVQVLILEAQMRSIRFV